MATGWLSRAGSRAHKCCSNLLFFVSGLKICQQAGPHVCYASPGLLNSRPPFKDLMAYNTNLRPQMACGQQCETLFCKIPSPS